MSLLRHRYIEILILIISFSIVPKAVLGIETNVDCEIFDLEVEVSECDADLTYDLSLNFSVIDPTSLSFDLWIDGEFINIFESSSLPLNIEDLEMIQGVSTVLLEVCINDNSDCCESIEYVQPECGQGDCEIYDLGIELGECDGGTYGTWIFFEVTDPTQDQFDLWVNGNFIGFYDLADIPIYVDGIIPLAGNYDYIEVCINDNLDCCATIEYLQPECLEDECEIFDIYVEPTDCIDGSFYFEVFFEYSNTSDSFDILGNGNNYGTFNYEDVPLLLGPFDSNDPIFYEFVIIDSEDPDCTNFIDFGEFDCSDECAIEDLIIDIVDCNEDGTYNMYFNFNAINANNDFFDYELNNEITGYDLISTLPYYLDSIVPRPMSDYDIIEVCVNDNPDCCAVIEYMQPACLTHLSDLFPEELKIEIIGQGIIFMSLPNANNGPLILEINDLQGKLLKRTEYPNSDKIALDLNEIRNGIYLMSMHSSSSSAVKKIVITH